MSKRESILVFGYFGYITNQLDGQTVKTRAIYDLMRTKGTTEVSFADSQEFRHSFKSIIRFLKDLVLCDTLLWLPAQNNLKYLFPAIWIMSKIFRFDIIYIVVGGWLSVFLENLPFHRNKLKGIKAILLENRLSVKELQSKYGFNNLDVIPNFREVAPKPKIEEHGDELKLVFMARVNKMKGLDVIAEIAGKLQGRNISIDIYGPIFSDDEQYFKAELIGRYPSIKYCGVLQPDEIYDTLVKYDAMLFPTHYYTEGFPGSIMDAYRSGLPVIATNWKHAHEFIEDGITGYIVDFENTIDAIIHRINILDADRNLLLAMKETAYMESLKYTPDAAWSILERYLK